MQINPHSITPSQDGSGHSGVRAGCSTCLLPGFLQSCEEGGVPPLSSGMQEVGCLFPMVVGGRRGASSKQWEAVQEGQGRWLLCAASVRIPVAPQGCRVLAGALCDLCQGFCSPMCERKWHGPAPAPHGPEAEHRGSTPGLGAILRCAGHTGRDSGTWGGPIAQGDGERGPGSHTISCNGSLVYVLSM